MKQNKKFSIAIIGGTGKISEPFLDGFLGLGMDLKILARSPQRISRRFPEAEVIQGSMMNEDDAARVMKGVDAAFLITPIGPRNNKDIEVQSARPSIAAAGKTNLPHLIFVSCIGIDRSTGVALLDAKLEVEQMLSESGVPWTSIRCGSYMEDVIDTRVKFIRHGVFVFPVKPNLKFNFTAQKDIPRLVLDLLEHDIRVNGPLDCVDPRPHTPAEVAALMTEISGRRVRPSGKWPLLCILKLARPIFHLRNHRMSTIVHLVEYFNRHGYCNGSTSLDEVFPDFKVTTLEEHLHGLLGQAHHK